MGGGLGATSLSFSNHSRIFMKYYLALILFLNIIIYSQVDNNGNPIFYSITVSEDTLENFSLSSNYYTITNNINNPESSVCCK